MNTSNAPYSNQTINLDDLPSLTEIELNPVHPKYPLITVIRTAISQVIFLAIFTTAFILANLPVLLWIVVIVEIILAFSMSYAGAKRCRYAIREQDIISQKGLWQHKTTAVSFNRIQHIDISHDPLERKYQTATIKLFTAGGSSADLSISGLPQEIAQTIRQQVLSRLNNQHASHHQTDTEIKKDIESPAPQSSQSQQNAPHKGQANDQQ